MISRPSHSVSSPVILPLTGQDFFQPRHQVSAMSQEFVPSGSAQKCVFVGDNSLALWAGSALIARVVLKELAENYQRGLGYETIEDLVTQIGLTQSDVESISLILFRDIGSRIVQDTLNTQRLTQNCADIVHAGTGSFPVIHDLQEEDLVDDCKHFFTAVLNRLATAMAGEILTQENGVFNFGGWFELTECVGGKFSKVPYATKLWHVNGDKVADGPGFFSGYNENDLLLFFLDKRKKSAPPPFVVRDFLGRKKRDASPWYVPDAAHAFEFHIVYFDDLKKCCFVLLGKDELSIRVNVSKSGLDWNVNPDFLKGLWHDIRAGRRIGQELRFSSKWKD